ncbi:Xaa-Pro peptidase family protein [Amycolatopsis acidiphila]|uniref:Aminopeptidase P family protein n=1 Tax=Amycolatopsis acidiphila TaxID=715473 RepID=A0A558A249_9PSEU|nr:Xaa-Pro peptidase family protein [Amycolatopsis acidiphila]TVT18325.1 aminopeptidase P family protein [Amycolatopsis acidiphila]UIJ56730.1 Xaa-Pro peptidase family protein [Amycolatopsis acidiphila]GHG55483.1 X-Pro dipeptidase [Amycolatopsis acidiphila]
MPDLHSARRDSLRQLVRQAGADALLVTNLLNVRYLTGFTGSNAALLLDSGSEARTLFCTDGRYVTQAGAEVPDLEHVIDRDSVAALVKRGSGRTGFESQHVSVEQYEALNALAEGFELTRAPGLVEQLRLIKDEHEIEALRRACAAADAALAGLIERGGIRPGRTEREVARELENLMLDHGASGPSFDSIVAAGANSAIPHHRPADAVLAAGDFLKLDFGATVEGYHSDMTRTLVLGKAADWQRELYELVRRSQAAGSAAVFPGAVSKDVDKAAREVIEQAGHGDEFSHGLGHGVGLEIHEAPSLAKKGDGTLAVGMTVTVEPGVYLAGHGGVRIEDTLVVRDTVPELLTLSSKDLVVV